MSLQMSRCFNEDETCEAVKPTSEVYYYVLYHFLSSQDLKFGHGGF